MSVEITARLGMIVRAYDNVIQKIRRGIVEKALKKLIAGKTAWLDLMATGYLNMGGNACSE